MAIKEVCRLCLSADDLVWVFDKQFENSNMKDVVFITTGVEITLKDIISQKICKKCRQVTNKMFEFRRTSLKNDQHLREECKLILKERELKIPNTQVTIRSDGRKNSIRENVPETKIVTLDIKPETKPLYKIHPSVRELFKTYPQIKLPTVCLKYDISPCVSMMMDQVEQYFKFHKIDFQKHTKLALKAGNIATKKTFSVLQTKNLNHLKQKISSKMQKTDRKDKLPKLEVKTEPANSSINDKNSNIKILPEIKEDSKAALNHHLIENKPTVDEMIQSNKRKFSEMATETSETGVSKKSNFIESLGLTIKTNGDNSGGASYITNKTLPVHICEICNSVQYSAKDLRKHQNKHLRCQFCKLKFRSLDSKKEHLDKSCSIKNVMNNLPQVKLQRVDYNEWIRSRYPEAFQDFPTLNSVVTQSNVHSVVINPVQEQSVPKETIVSKPCEIIEILSDDDEDCSPSTSNVKCKGPSTQTHHDIQAVKSENIVYNTVSIVRPDIKIKGSSALDLIDARLTDIKVLKELLTIYRPVHLYADKSEQTVIPVNETILVNPADMNAELKALKPQLHVYKIPVVMKKGKFGVCYNYVSERNPPKKLCLWNDLTAIDIKPPVTKVIPSSSPKVVGSHNGTIALPSTTTCNSPGLGRPSQLGTPTTSKFIRVNANSLSPITTGIYSTASTNLIDTNPMLNSFLQSTTASDTQQITISTHRAPEMTPSETESTTTPLIIQSTTTTPLIIQSTTTTTPLITQSTPPLVPQSTTPLISQLTPPLITQSATPLISQLTPPLITQSTTPLITQSATILSDTDPAPSMVPLTTSSPCIVTYPQTSNTDTTVSNTVQQLGVIRVKNVWELT